MMDLENNHLIRDAYFFMSKAHKEQKRKFTGEAYSSHPEQVACMLSRYVDDEEMIASALLHDVVEDTDTTIEDILEIFGERVESLVGELTSCEREKKMSGKKIYLTKAVNEMSMDSFLIKLVDRLHNVMGLMDSAVPVDFVNWYVTETYYILDNLNREVDELHEQVIEAIKLMLFYIELTRKI